MPLLGARRRLREVATTPQPTGYKESRAENDNSEQYNTARVHLDVEPICECLRLHTTSERNLVLSKIKRLTPGITRPHTL